MTKLVEKALAAFNCLPEDRKDDIASMIIEVAEQTPYELTAEERQAVEKGIAAADAGDFASDEQVRALFGKFRTI